jgi:peptide/nickel transport system substrate-binding protein
MHMKKYYILLYILCIVVFISGCGLATIPESHQIKEDKTVLDSTVQPNKTHFLPEKGGELRIALTAPDTLNPLLTESRDTLNFLKLIYESPITYDASGKPTPSLFSDWEVSSDGRLWIFKVRKGVKWHNGEELDGNDILFTLEALQSGLVKSFYQFDIFENINIVEYGLRNEDPYTVYIRLGQPTYHILDIFTFPVLSKDIYQSIENILIMHENEDFIPIGTGPYKIDIAHYDGNENTIRLIRNESWWGGELYIDSILAKVYENNDASRTAFLEGQVDLVDTMVIYANTVWNRNNVEYHKYLTTEFEFLALNNSKSLFQDKTIKHAMAYAIDRKDIISKVYINNAETVDVPIPSTSWLYDSNYRIYDFEVDKARKLLYDAGWKDSDADGVLDKHIDGKKVDLSFSLLTNEENNSRRDVAELISNQLSLLGFQVNVEIEPWDIILEEKIPNGEFDVILTGYNMHPANDLRFLFHSDEIGKGLNNFIRYKSSELDRLLDNASRSFTEEERLKAYQRIQEHITSELPIISLYFKTGTLLTDSRVRGIDRLIDLDIYKDIESWFLIR